MSHWSQPLRVESPEYAVLITVRTINSALWFVNNKALERYILGYLAKYQNKYDVELYAFCIQGNHIHIVARFPKANRADFMRDLNARIASGVAKYVKEFLGGPVFERRYSAQFLPLDQDIENYFFYCALQAVNDGLAQRISEYPSYNSIYDALGGKRRKYEVVHYGKYYSRKRSDPTVSVEEYTERNELNFRRLPGYAELDEVGYEKDMLRELEQRRLQKVRERKVEGYMFPTKKQLAGITPGTLPWKTKKGVMQPIVLSCCKEARAHVLSWYFGIVQSYREISILFRQGDFLAEFPEFTSPAAPWPFAFPVI